MEARGMRHAILLTLMALALRGQSADIRAAWTNLSMNLVAAAAAMPEGEYGYRPTADVRSFGELVGHLADTHYMFCAPLVPQSKAATGAEKLTTKVELLGALKASVNFCTGAAGRLSDQNTAPVKFFNRDVSPQTIFWSNLTHSFEHYGNIATYMRMKGMTPPSSDRASKKARLLYDMGHGEGGPPAGMAEIAAKAGFGLVVTEAPLTATALKNVQLLYLRAPMTGMSSEEKEAVIGFVKAGGSLLVVVDEELRQPLATSGVNDVIAPFGMKLTPDTPYLHNCGAIAVAGEIHRVAREIPYSGGRAIEGGTAFAFQLDREGKQGQAFAAYQKVEGGGRVVAMGEGMASLFLGVANGERLTGVPRDAARTTYWGKDSTVFMQEVIAWLIAR